MSDLRTTTESSNDNKLMLGGFGEVLSYPGAKYAEQARRLNCLLAERLPDAAKHIAAFAEHTTPLSTTDQEEQFTRTFDINPACALEVGWHLFGEDYSRGLFLVRMREEMRRHGLAESQELPDHITHVLEVAGAMPHDAAAGFVRACVYAALLKMSAALKRKESPYADVMAALELVLADLFELTDEDIERAASAQEDAEAAYEISYAGAEEERWQPGCCSTGDVVPLDIPTDLDAKKV